MASFMFDEEMVGCVILEIKWFQTSSALSAGALDNCAVVHARPQKPMESKD